MHNDFDNGHDKYERNYTGVMHTYLFFMNKYMALNGYNIYHTYGPVIEIVKSYEN